MLPLLDTGCKSLDHLVKAFHTKAVYSRLSSNLICESLGCHTPCTSGRLPCSHLLMLELHLLGLQLGLLDWKLLFLQPMVLTHPLGLLLLLELVLPLFASLVPSEQMSRELLEPIELLVLFPCHFSGKNHSFANQGAPYPNQSETHWRCTVASKFLVEVGCPQAHSFDIGVPCWNPQGPLGKQVDGLFELRQFEQSDKLNSWLGPQENDMTTKGVKLVNTAKQVNTS